MIFRQTLNGSDAPKGGTFAPRSSQASSTEGPAGGTDRPGDTDHQHSDLVIPSKPELKPDELLALQGKAHMTTNSSQDIQAMPDAMAERSLLLSVAKRWGSSALSTTVGALPNNAGELLALFLDKHLPFRSFSNELLGIFVLRRLLSDRSNCVDVGTHRGAFLKRVIGCAPHGEHVCFEPIPEMAAKLRTTWGQRVDVKQVALSDHSGETTFFFYPKTPGLSGLARRDFASLRPEIRELRVEVTSLDKALDTRRPVDFIKIDVEGGELAVLRGAVETILRDRPAIWCEHHKWGAPNYHETYSDFWSTVTDLLGMQVFTARDWLLDQPALSREQFVTSVQNDLNTDYLLVPLESAPRSATQAPLPTHIRT